VDSIFKLTNENEIHGISPKIHSWIIRKKKFMEYRRKYIYGI